MALGAPSAFAASPSTPYALTSIDTPFPQPTGRFGERHAATDDINGDGVNDYFVGDLSEDVFPLTNAGRVYAISGRTRNVIYTILSPDIQNEAKFGFFISNLGDLDGDKKDDLAVGTDSQDTTDAGAPCTSGATGCNKDQGKAWVFSGKSGKLLYDVNNPNPQADGRFGSRIGRAGDVVKADGTPGTDGKPESIMGASNNDLPAGCGQVAKTTPPTPVPNGCRKNQGQAYIFNGNDGKPVQTLNLPPEDQATATCGSTPPAAPQPCGTFGLSVQGPGDVDGDGVTDQLVDAGDLSLTPAGVPCTPPASAGSPNGCNGGQGRMYLFSGKTGNLLSKIDDPTPQQGASFGFQDAAPLSPGDLNGDGSAEIFANGFTQAGADGLADEGRVWIFDGKATVAAKNKNGVVLYEPKDPTPTEGGQFAFSLAKTDYNKDGTPDLFLGQSPHHLQKAGVDQTGGTYIFDGRNGSLLKSLVLPAGPGTAAQNEKNPLVAQRGSGTFAAGLGSNLGWSVAAPGDLNGDGEPDYLAGATWQDNGANQDEGRAFVFLSGRASGPGAGPAPGRPGGGGSLPPKPKPKPKRCVNSAGVRVLGKTKSGGRVLRGTKGKDRICGTRRGDVIAGLGGRDVIFGAGGDDRINGGSGGDRINGGSGRDRISGSSGNDIISGVSGNDRINGNSGSDRINGNSGDDRINGGSGNDIISGSSGNDRINGNSGNDRINGNSGNDTLSGSSGRDYISGSSGNDRLNGGSGRDRLVGGTGRDKRTG